MTPQAAMLNTLRQRAAYARPEQRQVNADAYKRAVGQLRPRRPRGKAGFGGPQAEQPQSPLAAFIAMLSGGPVGR